MLAFGLSTLIIQSDFIFDALRYLGAIYIFYLSFEVYNSDYVLDSGNKFIASNFFLKNLKKGILMNLLNPKVFLFFALFFSNFIFSETLSFKIQIIILGLIFIIITFFVFGIIILFSDVIFTISYKKSKFNLFSKLFNIIVLLVIGIIILFTENTITLS